MLSNFLSLGQFFFRQSILDIYVFCKFIKGNNVGFGGRGQTTQQYVGSFDLEWYKAQEQETSEKVLE